MKSVLAHGLFLMNAKAEDSRVDDRSIMDANLYPGPCPAKPDVVKNFSKERYQGTWYEIYKDRSTWYQLGDDCVTTTWFCDDTFLGIPNMFPLIAHECSLSGKRYISEEDRINSTDLVSAIKARCPYEDGQCFVKTGDFLEGNLYILDTDYDNYTIQYACSDFVFAHEMAVWLFSRTPRISDDYVDYAKKVIKDKIGEHYNVDQ
jgi:lipocalin